MNTISPSRSDHADARNSSARLWIGACVMLTLIVLFFMLREHWEHVAGKWPYLLLLACPLIHVFMHGKHKHAGHEHMPPTTSAEESHSRHA